MPVISSNQSGGITAHTVNVMNENFFKEKRGVFNKVREVLKDVFQHVSYHDVIKKLDSFFDDGEMFFTNEKTKQFLKDFRYAVVHVSYARRKTSVSEELRKKADAYELFLAGLLDGHNLLNYFPELKTHN